MSARDFCSLPAAQALGWPKNIGHATAPHQAMAARFAQKAAEVIALSATGESLDADLVVTEGHKHNSLLTLIYWRQLAAWPIVGRSITGSITIGQTIRSTAEQDLGLFFFRMPSALGVRVTDTFYLRLRATVPGSGAPASSQVVVSGDLLSVGGFGVLSLVQALPPLNLFAQVGPPIISYLDQWFFYPVEVNPLVTDPVLVLRLRARVLTAGDEGQVFEAAVGLRGGL